MANDLDSETAAMRREVAGRQRVGALVLLTVAMVAILASMPWYPAQRPTADLRGPTASQVSLRLDPETAAWYELAQLPGIGETLGRRIVEYRDDRRKHVNGGRVFRRPADLDSVPGFGPRTLERLAPYLRFGDEPGTSDATGP